MTDVGEIVFLAYMTVIGVGLFGWTFKTPKGASK